jgi:hypothetical protein
MKIENPNDISSKSVSAGTENVENYLSTLEHPLKPEILALRKIILNVDPSIGEDIKWNVPSFFTKEFFATFHLREKNNIQIILHFGEKKRDDSIADGAISDPESLLNWLGKDRASIKFDHMNEIIARQPAFENILRQWIQHI